MTGLLWWLGQNTIMVAVMIPLALIGCRQFRNRPAAQHVLWLVVLLKLVAPPIVSWPWTARQMHDSIWPAPASMSVAGGSAGEASAVETVPSDELADKSAVDVARPPLEFLPADARPKEADVRRIAAAEHFARTGDGPNWARTACRFATAAWLIGAAAGLAWQLRRIVRHASLVRRGTAATEPLRNEIQAVARQLGLRPPRALIARGIVSPFVWCLGRLRLVWPESLSSQADIVRSRGVIAHELAHIARGDHWVTWLELIAGIVWWWNPLFWFVCRRLRETAEMACDALAIGTSLGSRREYAELLLELSAGIKTTAPAPLLAIGAGTYSSFERRLSMVLSDCVSGKLSWGGIVVAIGFALLTLPGCSRGQQESQPAANSAANRAPPTDVDRHVASEDEVRVDVGPAPGDVYAALDGVVYDVPVEFEQVVHKGDVLARMRDTTLQINLADIAGKLASTTQEIYALRRQMNDPKRKDTQEFRQAESRVAELSKTRDSYAKQLELLEKKQQQLVVTSPFDGRVYTPKVRDLLLHRPVRQGQVLMNISIQATPLERPAAARTLPFPSAPPAVASAQPQTQDVELPWPNVVSTPPTVARDLPELLLPDPAPVRTVTVTQPVWRDVVPLEDFRGQVWSPPAAPPQHKPVICFAMDERLYLRYQRMLRAGQVKGAGNPLAVGLSDENGFPRNGALDHFDTEFDPTTGAIRVYGVLADADDLLLPGMSVRVRMTFGPPRRVLEVPQKAITLEPVLVLIVNERNIVEPRDVKRGQFDGDMCVIEQGLHPDDRVVIDLIQAQGLQPGERVETRIEPIQVETETKPILNE